MLIKTIEIQKLVFQVLGIFRKQKYANSRQYLCEKSLQTVRYFLHTPHCRWFEESRTRIRTAGDDVSQQATPQSAGKRIAATALGAATSNNGNTVKLRGEHEFTGNTL